MVVSGGTGDVSRILRELAEIGANSYAVRFVLQERLTPEERSVMEKFARLVRQERELWTGEE